MLSKSQKEFLSALGYLLSLGLFILSLMQMIFGDKLDAIYLIGFSILAAFHAFAQEYGAKHD